jgi:hypothetical protein
MQTQYSSWGRLKITLQFQTLIVNRKKSLNWFAAQNIDPAAASKSL